MSSNNPIPEDEHLQNAIYGTPKVNPDEQRKYLGTFRERVGLTISVKELSSCDWTNEFSQELAQDYVQIIFINGNLPQEKINPYIMIASKSGINFTMKTNPEFRTEPDNFAIVVANKQAIHISPVDITSKYPVATEPDVDTPKQSFWKKLFK